MKTRLGKIDSVYFGLGGYQGCMIGLHLSFKFEGSGVCTDICFWDWNKIECTEHYQWTEEDRSKEAVDTLRKLSDLLHEAKVDKVEQLRNIPVEVTFDGNTFKSFRILTEVL